MFAFGDLGKGPGQFKGPHGLAVDHKNNIYVADLYNHRIQVLYTDSIVFQSIRCFKISPALLLLVHCLPQSF